jgi:hypothetical protein
MRIRINTHNWMDWLEGMPEDRQQVDVVRRILCNRLEDWALDTHPETQVILADDDESERLLSVFDEAGAEDESATAEVRDQLARDWQGILDDIVGECGVRPASPTSPGVVLLDMEGGGFWHTETPASITVGSDVHELYASSVNVQLVEVAAGEPRYLSIAHAHLDGFLGSLPDQSDPVVLRWHCAGQLTLVESFQPFQAMDRPTGTVLHLCQSVGAGHQPSDTDSSLPAAALRYALVRTFSGTCSGESFGIWEEMRRLVESCAT